MREGGGAGQDTDIEKNIQRGPYFCLNMLISSWRMTPKHIVGL